MYEFGARKLTERLKKLVYGSTSDAEITQPSAAASYIHPPGAAAAYTPTTYNPHFRSHEIWNHPTQISTVLSWDRTSQELVREMEYRREMIGGG